MKHLHLSFLLTFSWSLNLMALPLDIENLKIFEPQSQGMKNTMSSELDDVITQFIEDEKIQGAVVAVSRFGNPIYFSAHGLADVPNKIAMEKDAMFQMWSSTKPVLGVAAMIAIERGLFSPEDEVGKYLPNFHGIEVAVLDDPKDKDVSPLGVYAQLGGETGFFFKLILESVVVVL
jgi:CubicO group peptidase (beta-lactamase class C family)